MQQYAYNVHFISPSKAQNDEIYGLRDRSRTVPIPTSITPVPGYPNKLVVFKIQASKYWQVRCWHQGFTRRKSTRTQSLRVAQSVARRFYEQLMASNYVEAVKSADKSDFETRITTPKSSFAALSAQMLLNEQARVNRGEFSRDSLQVLQNRLDKHILPRFGASQVARVDYKELLAFSQYLSKTLSSITVSQYLIAIRKVLLIAVQSGVISKLPEFPRIKIVTTPRGAFTPSEYWKIMRTARSLVGAQHPSTVDLKARHFKLRSTDYLMPADLPWAVGFMVNSFIRPSDLKTLKHRHVEIVTNVNTYLRLSLPITKSHTKPIVTLQPAVRIYKKLLEHQKSSGFASQADYVFLPQIKDRNYAQFILAYYFNWVLQITDLKLGPHGGARTLYSLRHSAITFRLLYGQGIDLLTLARNARTSVDMINKHYASTVSGEQNIGLLQSRRTVR